MTDEPHDTLAAEEFAIPAPDPGGPAADPLGVREPHDTLAAEEFAIPAGGPVPHHDEARSRSALRPALIGLAALAVLRRLRRR